jgi:nucleoside phosphorylase/tetratricopeptide (TPR) repeat protein
VAPAHRPDVAILIALPEEFDTLAREYAERWTSQPNPDYHGSDFVFEGPNGYRCVAAIMPRMGPTVAGQVSQRLLAWRPAVIINVGIAGGFVDDLRIGDVIVPRQVDAYDETGKVKGTQWFPRGSDYRPNAFPDMHELRFTDPPAHRAWVQSGARTVTELRAGPDAADVEDLISKKLLRSEPIVSTNHLASGSFVVASKPFAEWIRSTNADIHAGEMEAAGMMAAAEYRRETVQTLVVRGISDHVDADKTKVDRIGEGALRRLAMANAWRLVEMLMQLGKLARANASAEATARGTPPPKVAPTRLPPGAPTLFGRDDKLAQLETAWTEPRTKLITIVAWGGVGKTALVHEFRNRLCMRDEPAWVFDWSFYSQGTRDVGAVSADNFIREALLFFGDPQLADSNASAWQKGERLAELIGSRRTLLILDGLEPLQEPPAAKGQAGAVREQSVRALLLGLASRNLGLCLVTTRVAVLELQGCEGTTAPRVELERLSTQTGAAFLASLLGKSSGTEAELAEICEEVDGHALSLQLLGSYIRRALGGDVRRWREIELRRADEDQGGHAFRVIAAYERWLGQAGVEGERELAVLRMMGLFDRPAEPGCIAALRREPAIAGLTDAVVGLDREGWRALLSSLEEARLVGCSAYVPTLVRGYDEATARAAGQKGQPQGEAKPWPVPEYGPAAVVLDAHPLVREYFGDALRRSNEAAWREGHRRLYEHLCELVPHWPEGIEGLQPLYQALVHGCAAARVRESRTAVYQDRIQRGARGYSVKQLGAFGTNLAALVNFFEQAWDRPSRELSPAVRAWVLNEAAFCLRGVGRLSESLEPMRAGLKMYVELESWTSAAIAAGNLSELELTLGRVGAAVDDAMQAVAHADRSEDAFERMVKRTTLADARLAAGEWAQARELFEQAEAMQAQREPDKPQLYSLRGHQYCELLLCSAERAAWRQSGTLAEPSELMSHCTEVFERATRTLKDAVRNRWTHDIARDHLTCGRAALYAARIHTRAPTLACTLTLDQAREQLEVAVDKLREAGAQYNLPKGLLTRAWMHHLCNRDDLAHRDLDEAWTLAIRGPMPLFQADIELHRARLFHDRTALARAATLIHQLGYHRRLGELEDAQAQLPP